MRSARFSRSSLVCLLGSCLLMCSVTGCSRLLAQNDSKNDDQKKKSGLVAVQTVAVQQAEIRRTSSQPATVYPFYAADIRAKAHGYVSDVAVDIGDVVQAGSVLATISVPEMETRRLIAVAEIEKQKAEEARAAAGVALAAANVNASTALAAEARSQMQQVEASLAAAESEFSRTSDLVRRGSIQGRMLDEVRQRRDSEAAKQAAVTSSIDSAIANVEVAKAKLASAKADVKAAAASTDVSTRKVEEIDVLIKYATLTAPFDGVVTRRNVSPGDLVNERNDSEPLFVISQLSKVRIHIPVPENDAAFVNRGDSISLVFPSFSSEDAMTVSVTRHTGQLDPSTRMMLVEAEVENTDGKLIPGMFGKASIAMGTQVAANMLPARAVRFDESGKAYVYVVADDTTVSVVSVTTGMDNGNTIEIVSGLESGQTVISAHLQRFTEGQKVKVLD